MRRFVASLAFAALPASVASAQIVEEVRLGVMEHNVCVTDCDNANKEDGPDLNGEAVFASPELFNLVGSPRPYVIASINTAGDTSYGGAGLQWRWAFADGWAFEPGVGYVIHDGELDFRYPQGDPRNDPISSSKIYFGSRDLFRTSLALSRDVTDKWGVQVLFEHMSHGQIIGEGRNQGIDNVGVRVFYRLGE